MGQVEAFYNYRELGSISMLYIHTVRNTKYFTVNDIATEKEIDSALQRIMCEIILNFPGKFNISRIFKWGTKAAKEKCRMLPSWGGLDCILGKISSLKQWLEQAVQGGTGITIPQGFKRC